MAEIKCNGLVIKDTKVGEHDKIITILTKEHGKISVFCKGGRRRGTNASTQLMCYCQFVLTHTKNNCYLSQASLLESFYKLREDLFSLTYATYFCELASCLTNEMLPSGSILSLTLNTLHFLCQKKALPQLLKSLYEIRIISLAGFMPNMAYCVSCSSENDLCGFSSESGGILCKKCRGLYGDSIEISAESVSMIQLFLSPDLKKAFTFQPDSQTLKEVSHLTQEYIKTHINHKLPTLDYLEKLATKI